MVIRDKNLPQSRNITFINLFGSKGSSIGLVEMLSVAVNYLRSQELTDFHVFDFHFADDVHLNTGATVMQIAIRRRRDKGTESGNQAFQALATHTTLDELD